MTTSDDNNPVTQGQFKVAMANIDEKFDSIDKRFCSIDEKFDSIDKRFDSSNKKFAFFYKKIDEDMQDIRENMYTKQDHARDILIMDKMAAEVEESRRERLLFSKQMLQIGDRLFNHEKRIRALEKTPQI